MPSSTHRAMPLVWPRRSRRWLPTPACARSLEDPPARRPNAILIARASRRNSCRSINAPPRVPDCRTEVRVLHVYSGNLFGGIETMLLTLARLRGLCPSIEPEIALAFEGRLATELKSTEIMLHKLPEVRASRPHTIPVARRALAEILAARHYDRVICHAAWSQAMFGGVVKRANVPLVYWAHDVATGTHWTER